MNPALTPAEIRLRIFLKTLLWASLLIVFFHAFPKLTPSFLESDIRHGYTIFANHSFLQGGLLLFILALSIGDVRRFSPLIRLLLWFLAIGIIWSVINWIRIKNQAPGDTPYWVRTFIYAILLVCGFLLFRAAGKARYGLKYLSVQQFQTLEALAEVCVSGDACANKMEILPIEVATNVDTYLLSFRASSKWVMKLVLTAMEWYPLLSLHVPLSQMLPDARLTFLKKRFLTDEEFRATPDWYRQLIQAAIRMSKQLCYMGYYSDRRVYKSVGYIPFSERPDKKDREARFTRNYSLADKLKVMNEPDMQTDEISSDVVIVGSGAAASILARQLIGLGRKVLLIERGELELPDTYTENEVDMVSRLYADGALQLSRDFRFQVFQGSCVGGSTVVNNAVCFDTPDYILDRWIGEMGIGLDREKYAASMQEIYKIMHVDHTPLMTDDKYLNPGGRLFSDICEQQGYGKPNLDSVKANIEGCLGCGYCNIGCKFGRKLSMLDTILPQIQAEYPGSLQIIAGCEAISFNKNGNGKIISLTGQFKNGRKITIKGNTFVSSAGAISSSILLLKSKLGIANAGKKLAFNLGSQITAAFTQTVNSYDGLQISHFLRTGDRRYVMETWFNPPMFQSTAMPGWFEQHFHNMHHYGNMACTGVLVGTASNAEVKIAGLLGRDINYLPTEDDFNSLMEALGIASEIYLKGGAERVMPNTFNYFEYKTVDDLKENLRKDVKSSRDISTGTGHPQGGNVMSNDAATGVVDAGFKVFGFENLFVCDASVFPTSLGVNPQVTVMTLAHYAAPLIAANNRS
ncbi:GMC family oxidoreductase N-terminal domain-containing protein [Flavitalea flava]